MAEQRDPDLTGQTLCDRWQLIRLLGRGGMSAVYEARDTDGSRVAIKVLRNTGCRSPRLRQRFLREGRAASAVAHADAVRIVEGHETPDGHSFLVMELLEGRTLGAACDGARGPLDTLLVLRIAANVLDVLAEAHAAGVVHRDIKPENVFLTDVGRVKVLDFGIASMRDEVLQDASITQSGATLGTPAFMAPEQARGRQAHVDARTDVWCVGATMFYCLTGRHVHEGASNANEAIIFAATVRAPPLTRFRPDLAGRVANVVDRALAHEPSQRWPSARAMADAVTAAAAVLMNGDEPGAPVPSPWTAETIDEHHSPRQRDPLRGGVMALSILGVGAACAVLVGVHRFERRLPSPPVPIAPQDPVAVVAAPDQQVPMPPPAVALRSVPPVAPSASSAGSAPPATPRSAHRPHVPATAVRSPSPVGPEASAGDIPDSILDRWE